MSRNLILCLDGTSNRFKRDNTNVLKLFAMLDRSRIDQIVYYQPGIGTSTPIGIYGRLARGVIRILDLAFAILLRHHVCDAYRFLMRNYRPGDRIYIYGFSRGAYSARVLAGMIHMVGLLPSHNDEMIPFAWELFKRAPKDRDEWHHVSKFRKVFGARDPLPRIELLGIWDTVSSVRYLWRNLSFPYTQNNPSVAHVRHAVALDERRAYFRQNLWKADAEKQDVIEVWFAGVHCDVGGGYVAGESGLANVTLQWMKEHSESLDAPVFFDQTRVSEYLPAMDGKDVVAPNALAAAHASLRWYWWPVELLLKRQMVPDAQGTFRARWFFPRGRRRELPLKPKVHRSVEKRIEAKLLERESLSADVEFV